jgi:hypothetical protein
VIIYRRIKPDQPGAKKWAKKYDNRLVCVRYRYNEVHECKTKTVEIVVEKKHWKPKNRIPSNKIVNIRIEYGETQLDILVKAAGGHWNRGKKLWELPYFKVKALGLHDRMVKNGYI